MDSTHRDPGTESAPGAHCSQQTTEKAAIMATTPIIGHKRAHSAVESEGASAEATAPKQTTQPPPRALLVHLSTLLSCKKAIVHTVRAAVPQVLSGDDIPVFTDEDVLRAFSKSPIVNELMSELAKRDLTPDEVARLRECYPRIYYQVGAPLLTLAPHAKELLEAVKRRGDIALAVISSNPDEAVPTLITLGVGHLVDTVLASLPVEAHSGNTKADNAAKLFQDNWQKEVVPWFAKRSRAAAMTTTNGSTTTIIIDDDEEINIKPLLPAQALLVSCCLYDLCVAKAGGTQTCWIRKIGAGDEAAVRVSGAFDIVVEELDELRVKLFGDSEGKVENWGDENNKNKGEDNKDSDKAEGGKNKNKVEGDVDMEEGDKNKKPDEVEKKKEVGEDQVMGGIEQAGVVVQQDGAVAKSPAEADAGYLVMEDLKQEEAGAVKAVGEREQQASKAPNADGDQVAKTIDAGADQVPKAADADGDQVMQAAQDDEVDISKVEKVLE